MGRENKFKERNQSGEIMLEASIIFVMLLTLLLALLSLAFLYYQQAMLSTSASVVASKIAESYKFTDNQLGSAGEDTITIKEFENVKIFRSTFQKRAMATEYEKKAKEYLEDIRVPIVSLGFGTQKVDVKCKVYGNGIGRSYVKIELKQKTEFFLSGILELLGIADKKMQLTATAYAECTDLIGYASSVNFAGYASKKLKAFKSVGTLYTSLEKFSEALLP